MINIEKIKETVELKIAGSDKFIVDINVSMDNKINIIVDSDSSGVNINDCADISRAVEDVLNRDDEDFEIEVASAGLSSPLKMLRQYQKNINKDIDIVFANGRKLTAKLVEAAADSIDVEYEEKIIAENKKRKQTITKNETIMLNDVKSVKAVVLFKN
ncbi:MAG: ribosome assembly cofactor RimP [Prevotellaceae bacterium]|jgi:ribosome maturation factor RimP|nr:ribosome assembly cofactor RimP [Prevotellaceae bacterium]